MQLSGNLWSVARSVDTVGLAVEPRQMTGAAEKMVAERITPFIWLIRQLHPAVLAVVTVNVEILFHGNDPDRFFRALDWFYRFSTSCTSWSINPVIISNTKDVIFCVNRKRNVVETDTAGTTPETAWMVGISNCLENLLCDDVPANSAPIGSTLKT